VDVAVTELRARLSHWLDRARDGDEVVVTDRGVPVARILRIDSTATIESLQKQGIIARPTRQDRPTATGRTRSKSRRPVSDLVGEQRR
jgi:prevent-host-death family protein